MATCRKIQYPMMDRTAKQNVPAPAARPSTPSVMFTALDEPTITTTAKITHTTSPRSTPMASDRVNESAVDAWAQCTASSAKTIAHTSCAADFPRLLSPRLRRWCTLM